MKSDCCPYICDLFFRNPVASEEVPGGIGPVDFEPQMVRSVGICQAQVVEHGPDVQLLQVHVQAAPLPLERAEQINPARVMEQQIVRGLPHKCCGLSHEPRIRDRNSSNYLGQSILLRQ